MYEVKDNDTLENISRKVYGTEKLSYLLKNGNPDIDNKLVPNTSLIIPKNPNEPKNKNQLVEPKNKDEVSVLINGKNFKHFLKISIIKSLDRIDSVEFDAPMESENKDFKNTFKPFAYADVQIYIGNEILFDGTMLDITPESSNNGKVVLITCYAKCGVLNDCTPSSNQLENLEFNQTKLKAIANKLIEPFGLKAIFKDDEGAVFERVAINPDENILSFLTGLANKRELVISSDNNGDLVFQKAITSGEAVSSLEQNLSPVINVRATFSPQNYYSHITGIEPVEVGLDGSKFTVKNEKLKGTFRPYTYKVEDTEASDMKKAVSMKMGKMFGEMVSYTVTVIGWRDKKDKLFKPNTFIKLKALDSMVYTSYKFLIKSVNFELTRDDKITILNLVLPESYSGEKVKVLPWEE